MGEYEEIEKQIKSDVLVSNVEKDTWNWAIKLSIEDYSLDVEDERRQRKQTLFVVYGMIRSIFRFTLKCYDGNTEKLRYLIDLIMEDISESHTTEARS